MLEVDTHARAFFRGCSVGVGTMTQSAKLPDLDDEVLGREGARTDRKLDLFLKFGAIALAVLLVGFGVLYFLDQRTPKAPSLVQTQIELAEQAIRDQPNNVKARLDLGLLYHHAGRLDEAIAQFDQVLRVVPENGDAHMGKGAVLQAKGDLLGATAEYTAVTNANKGKEFSAAGRLLPVGRDRPAAEAARPGAGAPRLRAADQPDRF